MKEFLQRIGGKVAWLLAPIGFVAWFAMLWFMVGDVL